MAFARTVDEFFNGAFGDDLSLRKAVPAENLQLLLDSRDPAKNEPLICVVTHEELAGGHKRHSIYGGFARDRKDFGRGLLSHPRFELPSLFRLRVLLHERGYEMQLRSRSGNSDSYELVEVGEPVPYVGADVVDLTARLG